MNVDLSKLITAEAKAANSLASARASASLSRRAFCLGLAQLSILTPEQALAAAKGDWPASMQDFLAYLNAEQALDAQIEWAAVGSIDRMHPLVLTLASWLSLPDATLDALFEIPGSFPD